MASIHCISQEGWERTATTKDFGSASYYVGGPLRTWLEYDGFGLNEGILLTHKVGKGHGSFNLNGSIGFVRGKYFLFSGGIGF